MKILMPVDGSLYTKRMLSYIAAHDELLGADHDYTVLTVVMPIPDYIARAGGGSLDEYYREQSEQVLSPVRAFVEQQPWKARLEHRSGHAAQVIAEFARDGGFDLIVMGTHGHSGLRTLVLGSITNGVLARCSVPVLLIR